MKILNGKTRYVLFDELRNELTSFLRVSCQYIQQFTMKGKPVKKPYMFDQTWRNFSLKLSVSIWKRENNKIRFQTKNDVIARPDWIGSNREGLTIWNWPLSHLIPNFLVPYHTPWFFFSFFKKKKLCVAKYRYTYFNAIFFLALNIGALFLNLPQGVWVYGV